MLALHKIHHSMLNLYFFCNDNIYLWNKIFSFDTAFCKFRWSSAEAYSVSLLVSFIFSLILFSIRYSFLSRTPIFSFTLSNIGKPEHGSPERNFAIRSIFIKPIMWFQINKHLLYNAWANRLKVYVTFVFKISFKFQGK